MEGHVGEVLASVVGKASGAGHGQGVVGVGAGPSGGLDTTSQPQVKLQK